MAELSITQTIAVSLLPLLFAITLHEVAHGWVALLFGDQTAKLSGRLTINPLKHIDLVGTIIVPLLMLLFTHFIFGWAKPVPVDPRNMRNPRSNMAWVALAGPTSNFLMALIWAGLAKLGMMNIDTAPQIALFLIYSGQIGISINLILMIFNCLPIPPFDGSKVLMSVLPGRLAWKLSFLDQYGFLIITLLLLTGVLSHLLYPPVQFLTDWIYTLFSLNIPY